MEGERRGGEGRRKEREGPTFSLVYATPLRHIVPAIRLPLATRSVNKSYHTRDTGRTTAVLSYVRSAFMNSYRGFKPGFSAVQASTVTIEVDLAVQ